MRYRGYIWGGGVWGIANLQLRTLRVDAQQVYVCHPGSIQHVGQCHDFRVDDAAIAPLFPHLCVYSLSVQRRHEMQHAREHASVPPAVQK